MYFLQQSCLPRQCIIELQAYIRKHPNMRTNSKAKMELLIALAQSELDRTKALETLRNIKPELLGGHDLYRLQHAIFVCETGKEEKHEAYKQLVKMRIPLYLPGDESLNARINLAFYRYYYVKDDETQAKKELERLFYKERLAINGYIRKHYRVHYDYWYGENCQYAGYYDNARKIYESVLRDASGLEILCHCAEQKLKELNEINTHDDSN